MLLGVRRRPQCHAHLEAIRAVSHFNAAVVTPGDARHDCEPQAAARRILFGEANERL